MCQFCAGDASIPINEIPGFVYCKQLDIFMNEMRPFMGLKYLEVFLLSEEDPKTSGTNQISLKGCGKNMSNTAKH